MDDDDHDRDDVASVTVIKSNTNRIPSEEVLRIRAKIWNHVLSIARDLEIADASRSSIPIHIQGIYRTYLEAVRNNALAKQCHATLLEQIKANALQQDERQHLSDFDQIRTHLDALKQQQRSAKLSILEHYTTELNALSQSFRSQDNLAESPDDHITPPAGQELSMVTSNVKDTITRLEFAVVQAKNELNAGRTRLQTAKMRLSSSCPTEERTKVRALNSTRIELTKWLEDSLVSCNSDERPLEAMKERTIGETVVKEPDITAEYQAYLRARTNLLAVLTALDNSQRWLLAGKQEVEQYNSGVQPPKLVSKDELLTAEQKVLDLQQTSNTNHVRDYVQSQARKVHASTMDVLDRLADESHLLPAYPILARSGRFQEAQAALGRKHNAESETDTVGKKLDAWAFAAEAAMDTTTNAVTSHQTRGEEAMENAREHIRDLSSLRSVVGGLPK